MENKDLKRNELIKLKRISKKNTLIILIILLIILLVTIGIGVLINLEFNDLYENYNILINSVLEKTRSYYLGFEDSLLQYYTCDDNLNNEIKKEMITYLSHFPIIISSYAFTSCINIFNLKPLFGNISILEYTINKKYEYFKLYSNFNNIIKDIDNCMDYILTNKLAKQSIFLKIPIIDSKKQLWSIHQKISNITNTINENLFGSKSLICNYFMIFDLEGGPRITGVIVNGTVYQAPLFKVDNIIPVNSENHNLLSQKFEIENTNIYFDSNNEYKSIKNDIYDFLQRKLYPLNFKEITLLKKFWENKNLNKEKNEIKNQYQNILNNENLNNIQNQNQTIQFNQTQNTKLELSNKQINDKSTINHIKNDNYILYDSIHQEKINTTFISKFSGMRTIYIPTSPILSNIEVFITGMKELERNVNNNLNNNISNIKIFTYLIFFMTIFTSLFLFIPLIFIEKEKTKTIYSLYAYVITERFKYLQEKYFNEIKFSSENIYLLFSNLFIKSNQILDQKINNNYHQIQQLIKYNSNLSNIEKNQNHNVHLIIKQLIGIIKYNNYILWEFSYFISYCLKLLSKRINKNEIFHEKYQEYKIENFNLFLELIIISISRKYSDINLEYSPEIFNTNFQEINLTKNNLINMYLISISIIYCIKQYFKSINQIFIKTVNNLFILKIKLENINSNIIKNFNFNKFLKENQEKYKSKNINNFLEINIEDFILQNDWFQFLIEESNINFFININSENEILLEMHVKTNNQIKRYINEKNENRNIYQTNKNNKIFKTLFLSNKSDINSYYYLINQACYELGLKLNKIKNLNDLFNEIIESKFLIIFIEKNYSNIKEFVTILSNKYFKNLHLIAIYWLEEADPIYMNKLCYNQINDNKIDSKNIDDTSKFFLKNSNEPIFNNIKINNYNIDNSIFQEKKIEYNNNVDTNNNMHVKNGIKNNNNNNNDNKITILNNSIKQYLFKKPITPIKIQIVINKLLLEYKNENNNTIIENENNEIKQIIKNYYYYINLSRQNFIANNILLYKDINKLINYSNNDIDEKNLPNEYIQLYKRGVPIEIIRNVYSFHFIPRFEEFINKNIILNKKNNYLNKQDKFLIENNNNNYNLSTIFDMTIDEIKIEIKKVIFDILSIPSNSDKIIIKLDLIMEIYEISISKIFSNINNMNYLQFFGPHLILHSVIVFKIFLKNSVSIIENIILDKDLLTAFIICFVTIPLCKPGISSEILSFTNSIMSLYTNEAAEIENYVCNIINKILSLPKFSILFENIQVSYKN